MTYPDESDLAAVHESVCKLPYVVHSEAWEDIRERGEGDCKDSALGFLHALQERGWPIEALCIGIVLVEPAQRIEGQTHAILVVSKEWALDERRPKVMSLTELDRIGYVPVELQDPVTREYRTWTWE